jgi:methionine sulfoxide reductase heme-binding subunit
MFDQVLWFAARGAGIVSLLLSTAVVSLGLLTAGRWQRPEWPRFLTVELHRSVALVSVVFVAIHVITAILDPYASLGLAAAIVPLASVYRPIPVALGVISVDLLIAVLVSSLVRDRIGGRAWRAIHWLAYGAWPLAIAHSLTAGSDAFAPWMIALVATCVATVVAILIWRWSADRSGRAAFADVVERSSLSLPPAHGGGPRTPDRGGPVRPAR